MRPSVEAVAQSVRVLGLIGGNEAEPLLISCWRSRLSGVIAAASALAVLLRQRPQRVVDGAG